MLVPAYAHPARAQSQFLHQRALKYAESGTEVRVYVRGDVREVYSLEGIPIVGAPLEEARKDLNSFSPDVIAIHAPWRGFQMDLARASTAPKVSWIHGAEALFPSLYYHHLIRAGDILRIPRWLKEDFIGIIQIVALRKFLPLCRAVIYVSDWMRRAAEFYLRVRHHRSLVIPNPVDLELFKFRRRERPEHGLSIRSLYHQYGIDVAVKALAGLTGCDLTVVGQGELERYVKRLATRSGASIHFDTKGYEHREVPVLMQRFDFFVAPSRTESQGVAMCEAMATGMPVVATRVGGIPEFVRDGVDGILYWPNKPGELRKAIRTLIRDKSRFAEMSESARKHMEMLCGPSNTIERELDVLAEAAVA